jgi:hypothetical protein
MTTTCAPPSVHPGGCPSARAREYAVIEPDVPPRRRGLSGLCSPAIVSIRRSAGLIPEEPLDATWHHYLDTAANLTRTTGHTVESLAKTFVKHGEVAADRVERAVDGVMAGSGHAGRVVAERIRAEAGRVVGARARGQASGPHGPADAAPSDAAPGSSKEPRRE